MVIDAPTISALAAAAAATAAASVAAVQLFVGYRQSKAALISAQAAKMSAESVGRHTVAAFRQKWIETVRDTLSEYHSIVMPVADDQVTPPEDFRKLASLKTKLELMLNPNESDSNELLALLSIMRLPDNAAHRMKMDAQLSELSHRILKTEWVRIKSELR